MMTVSYRDNKYKVPWRSGIKLYYLKGLLLTRRLYRFVGRCLRYAKNLLPTVALVIAFCYIAHLVNISVNPGINTIWETLWELRTFLMSTIVISYSTMLHSLESKRHEKLKIQFIQYSELQFETECCIDNLMDLIGLRLDSYVFLTEEKRDTTIQELEKLTAPTTTVDERRVVFILDTYESYLNYCLRYTQTSSLANECDYEDYVYGLRSSIEQIREEKYNIHGRGSVDTSFIIDLVRKIILGCCNPIKIIRRPWRVQYDYDIDQQIRMIITEQGVAMGSVYNWELWWFTEEQLRELRGDYEGTDL